MLYMFYTYNAIDGFKVCRTLISVYGFDLAFMFLESEQTHVHIKQTVVYNKQILKR